MKTNDLLLILDCSRFDIYRVKSNNGWGGCWFIDTTITLLPLHSAELSNSNVVDVLIGLAAVVIEAMVEVGLDVVNTWTACAVALITDSGMQSDAIEFMGTNAVDGDVRVAEQELCEMLAVVVVATVLSVPAVVGVEHTVLADDGVRFNLAQLKRKLQLLLFFDFPSLLQFLQHFGCDFFFFWQWAQCVTMASVE